MNISIALCTYNGSRFLSEQLASFAMQSRLPDEVVLVDDRSSDDTLSIARDFALNAPFPVVIVENEVNLGSTQNFEKAITLCTGDIIALSDQDDVWMPEKLERLARVFASRPEVGMVFSNASIVDDSLNPIDVSLWSETFRPRDRRAFASGRAAEVLLQYNVVTGATMAFRRELVKAIVPVPVLKEFIHDAWIALIASLASEIVAVKKDLIMYRQHSGQQLGAGLSRWEIPRSERYRLTIEDRLTAIARIDQFKRIINDEFLDRLRSIAPDPTKVPSSAEFEKMLINAHSSIMEHIEHISARLKLPAARPSRVADIIGEMATGRYREYSRGWQSAVLDLVRK